MLSNCETIKGNNLLMVGNFPSGTGYAWKMIGSCFTSLGRYFLQNGHNATVCFPQLDIIPDYYKSSGIEIIEFDFEHASALNLLNFIRNNKVNIVYFIDKPSYSIRYAILRLGGVRYIVIHDHTSGGRSQPKGFKRLIKIICNRIKFFSADKILAISNFVRERQVFCSCVPTHKLVTIFNGIDLSDNPVIDKYNVHELYRIPCDKKIIFCSGRANLYKGIHLFIRAAEILINHRKRDDLFFLYCGDGPDFIKLKSMIQKYSLERAFLCTGYVDYIDRILPSVDVCVVPSIWQEGFGLVVIEAMAAGIPVIASKVGGMAEIIDDGIDGFYIEPGDYLEIANIIEKIVDNTILRDRIVKKAKYKIRTSYNLKKQQQNIIEVFQNLCGV